MLFRYKRVGFSRNRPIRWGPKIPDVQLLIILILALALSACDFPFPPPPLPSRVSSPLMDSAINQVDSAVDPPFAYQIFVDPLPGRQLASASNLYNIRLDPRLLGPSQSYTSKLHAVAHELAHLWWYYHTEEFDNGPLLDRHFNGNPEMMADCYAIFWGFPRDVKVPIPRGYGCTSEMLRTVTELEH